MRTVYLRSGLIGALVLVVTTFTGPAYADPVTVRITSGYVAYPILNEAQMIVQFPNGSARVEWSDENGDWAPDFYGQCCTPGKPLNLSADESLPEPWMIQRTFGELRYGPDVYAVTEFSFVATARQSINVPRFAEPEATFSVPFDFEGVIRGRHDASAVLLHLVGSGQATADIRFYSHFNHYFLDGADYEFADGPAPVPEPATLLLMGAGIAVIGRRVRNHGGNRRRLPAA